MAMNDRDKRALRIGGVLVGVAVLYRLVLSPMLAGWAEARAEGAMYTTRIIQFEDKLDRREDLRKRLRERYGSAIDRPLLSIDELRVAFPRSVQDALSRASIEITQVEVQGVRRLRNVSGVSSFALRVRGTCNDRAIPAMLNELRKADQVVVIDSLDLTMSAPGRRDQWQLVLTLSTPGLGTEGRR